METLIDFETATLVKNYLPRNAVLYSLSEFFGACADATRTKIICALSISELCVSDLCNLLSLNQTTCSHQLRYLRSAGIVKGRRQGKIIFYSLRDKRIEQVIEAGAEFLGYIAQR
jgi:ArsR family transcriptional regulator